MDTEPTHLLGLSRFAPQSGSHKGTRDCEADDCSKSTREGKPYCSKHIEFAPYIQSILAKLEGRAQEERALEAGGSTVDLQGFFVREALLLLRTKDFTFKSFSRRLDISHKATKYLIEILKRHGLAQIVKTSRGGKTVRGTGPRDLIDGI